MIEGSVSSTYSNNENKPSTTTMFGARTRSVTSTYLTKVSSTGNTLSNYDTGLSSTNNNNFNKRTNSISDRISNFNAKQDEADRSVNIFKNAHNRSKKESGNFSESSSSNKSNINLPPVVKPRTSKQNLESGDTQSSKPTSDPSDPSDPIEVEVNAEEPQVIKCFGSDDKIIEPKNLVVSPITETINKIEDFQVDSLTKPKFQPSSTADDNKEKTLEEKIIDSDNIVKKLEARMSFTSENTTKKENTNNDESEEVFDDFSLQQMDDLGLSETTRKLIKSRMSSSTAAN